MLGQLGRCAGYVEEEIEGVPVITRPKPSHLENMTQALLSDLASQSQQIRDLTTEVQGLKRGAAGVDMQASIPPLHFQQVQRQDFGR